jgi:hypothetical protein
MYKHAAAVKPASQDPGFTPDRYCVVAYLRRPDRWGAMRVFRFRTTHYRRKEARRVFEMRRAGAFEYAEMYIIKSCELVDVFGDDAIEDEWLDHPPLD